MKQKIYILHGWAYSSDKWQPFVDFLSTKGIEAKVLRIPGLTAPLQEVWTLTDYVEWLHKELADEKGPVILLGHSNGGRICVAFTSRYPKRVKQLLLIDSAGIYHNELPIRIKRFVFGSIAKFGRKLHESERMRGWLYRLARENDYRRANPVVRKTMHNLISIDLSSKLSAISVPTTIIWGELDTVTPLVDGKLMHDKIVGSTLHVVLGARHSPQFTHVTEVGEEVVKSVYGNL
jgi:pimeloyl-ACP methyl ester carboxylesterase